MHPRVLSWTVKVGLAGVPDTAERDVMYKYNA